MIAAALAAGCSRAPEVAAEQARAAAVVTCQPASSAMIDDIVEVAGVIAPPPKLDAIMSSPMAGRVAEVWVEEGDPVAAGATIVTIEDPALPAGALEARAAVAGAEAAKLAAEQDVARQQRLVDTGIGARRDLDDARAKAATTAAELDAANARAGLARSNNARRELRAPHAGVVLHLWKRVGESVDGTAATPVAEVADLSTLELRAQLPPPALARVRDGMAATVRVVGLDAALAGKVARVAPAVDPATLLGGVRIEIAGSHRIAIGSAANGQIVVARHAGLVVPTAAVRRSMIGADEVIACVAGVAQVRAVTIGRRGEATEEIATGIAAGDAIVVDHVLGLEDGQPLATAPAGPK